MVSDWFLGLIDIFSVGNAPIGQFELLLRIQILAENLNVGGKITYFRFTTSGSGAATSDDDSPEIQPRWCIYTTSLAPLYRYVAGWGI